MPLAKSNWEWNPAMLSGRSFPIGHISVRGVVQHFTAAGDGRNVARWVAGKTKYRGQLVPPAQYFAHVITCRDGHIIQQQDFARMTHHAAGRVDPRVWDLPVEYYSPEDVPVNEMSLGIENSNYGWLLYVGGVFYIPRKTASGWEPGRRYPKTSPAPMRAYDVQGVERWWEPFTDEIIAANIEVLSRMVEVYPAINQHNVVRHSEISPDRKTDPGPLFPHDEIKAAVFSATTPDAEDVENLLARRFYDPSAQLCRMPDPN